MIKIKPVISHRSSTVKFLEILHKKKYLVYVTSQIGVHRKFRNVSNIYILYLRKNSSNPDNNVNPKAFIYCQCAQQSKPTTQSYGVLVARLFFGISYFSLISKKIPKITLSENFRQKSFWIRCVLTALTQQMTEG